MTRLVLFELFATNLLLFEYRRKTAKKRCSECGYASNSKHWFTTSFLQPLPYYFSYAIGSRKLSANKQSFVGAQTLLSLLQTTQIKQGVSLIAANKVYTSTNKTTVVSIETELFFFLFYPGGCVSCLRACFGARLLLRSY